MALSVTRLLGLGLTPGKLRGLQRISNPNGTLTMVATDQNSSMISMMKKATGKEPTYAEVTDAKVMLSKALSPYCSGLLVDGYYGYFSTIAANAVPASTGLLIRVEKSGATKKNAAGAPCGEVEPGWGVHKIKSCGADAVKLLAQFEPGEFDSAERNFEFTKEIYNACIANDILFLLEPIHFAYNGEKDDSPSKIARKASTVIESARILSRFCDVYKSEFPGTTGVESDAVLADNLKKLNDACGAKPWVLLSAGVDYPQYKKQVEMAMKAGASGILGGRAFWKEFFTFADPAQRQKFAETECVSRVRELDEIVKTGTPWFAKYGYTADELTQLRATEGWHARYCGGVATTTGAAGKVDPNAVYWE